MNVTGVLWMLYPLIGFLGILEFTTGLVYSFFCLPFFAFLLPLIAGVLACITSVYALMIQYNNRCELSLQFLSALSAFLLFLTTCTEALCLRKMHQGNGAGSVCAGLLNRTLGSQMACADALGGLQADLLLKLGIVDVRGFELHVARFLAVCSFVHWCAGVVLTLFSAFETRFRLAAPHWQVVVGLGTLLVSYAYHSYCCVFFFAYLPTVVACFCLAQAAVPWHFRDKSVPRQMFAVVGAALSTALVALASFGLYCWANKFGTTTQTTMTLTTMTIRPEATVASEAAAAAEAAQRTWAGVARFCVLPPRIYTLCQRSLEFSKPYVWWTAEQVALESSVVQLLTYLALAVTGSIHFGFFIHDAFG